MKNKSLIVLMALVSFSPLWTVAQSTNTSNTEIVVITVQDVNCQITWVGLTLEPDPRMGLKESDKAIDMQLMCALNPKIGSGAIRSSLMEEGRFVDKEENVYVIAVIESQRGEAVTEEEYTFILTLTTVVPKDLDLGTLNFVFGDRKIPLKPFIKD